MNFFTTFYTFIQNSVLNMVSAVTNDISASIAPALVTFATIYVMIWGYLHLRGGDRRACHGRRKAHPAIGGHSGGVPGLVGI